jgi:hypothetical protein
MAFGQSTPKRRHSQSVFLLKKSVVVQAAQVFDHVEVAMTGGSFQAGISRLCSREMFRPWRKDVVTAMSCL